MKPGIYEHYKGKQYQVLGIAHHSETEQEFVVYKALYETTYGHDSLWVRPKDMFEQSVMVDGVLVKRFKWVSA